MKLVRSLESALTETGDDPVCRRTLEYIFDYLHHNCYLLKVVNGKKELMKLQSSSSPPSARKTLRKKVKSAKTIRVLGCVVKQFNTTTSVEWERFVNQVEGINDGIYILNLTDALMLKKDRTVPWEILGSGKLESKYEGEMLPIFGGSTAEGYEDIAIPNYDDVRVVMGYDKIEQGESWDNKDTKVIFRGSSTGCGRKEDTNMRLKVAKMDKEWLDAGITKLTKSLKFDPVHGLGRTEKIPTVSQMSFEEQSKHKFILNIDGNVAAYRLLKWFQTGSLIFKVKGPFKVWYENELIDMKTVIEIKADLSDLEEKYEWCLKNDKKCKKIAENAMKLSKKLLTLDSVNKAFRERLNDVKTK
uniref:Glycosyl transferase CAP10 domain-containing protein n=1 Tax=viral metagenome TaxID=1070528 RepID=A0A6C0CI22_9ZZZZ